MPFLWEEQVLIVNPPNQGRLAVYVAGPYTGGDTGNNVRDAVVMADQLVKLGFLPYVPHLTHLWHMISPHEQRQWLDMGCAWLARCDAVLRLPGDSPGADVEEDYARRLGLLVFYDVASLTVWRATLQLYGKHLGG